MSEPRGDSEKTKLKILGAARQLFADRGINAVSVRDIAQEAGVTHALVHRYFGSKDEMAAAILTRELERLTATGAPTPAPPAGADPFDPARALLKQALGDSRTTLKLISRAELDGFEPAKMLEGRVRLLAMLTARISAGQEAAGIPAEARHDPALVSATIGAAVFALASMGPWFMGAAGLDSADLDARQDEFVEIIIDMIAQFSGAAR